MIRWKFKEYSLLMKGFISVVALAGMIYGAVFFIHSLYFETTDNAYVAGIIVPVSSEVKGRVAKVYVNDNQFVTAATPLLEIFQDDYVHDLNEKQENISRLAAEKSELTASLEEKNKTLLKAHANLNAAVFEENLAGNELKRYEKLIKGNVISQSQYDRIETVWKMANAKKESARAAVAEAEAAIATAQAKQAIQNARIKEANIKKNQAQLELSRTVLQAPASGRIAMKNVNPGKYVQPGQTLLAIVQDETWVIANYKETQIKKMTVGQPVKIKVDAYPGIIFKGHVDSLQAGTGSVFSLLPPENATGYFVKVVQRIPVKIVMDSKFDPAHPLWPGLSVVASVDIHRETESKLK